MSKAFDPYGSAYDKRERFAWNVYMGWSNDGFISNAVSQATLTHWKYIIMNNDELRETSEIFKVPWESIG